MSIFDLFGNKYSKSKKVDIKVSPVIMSDAKKNDKTAIALQNADSSYKEDKNLDKVISTYESILDRCSGDTFNYQIKLSKYYFAPFCERMKYHLLRLHVNQCDETPVQVLEGQAPVLPVLQHVTGAEPV